VPFPVTGLVPSKYPNVLFLAQIVTKQNGVVNYLRRRSVISISVIIASSEFEARP